MVEKLSILTGQWVLVFLLWAPLAFGETVEGKVSDLEVSGNAVYFRIAGAPFADCAKNRRYLLNASTAYGRNFYLFIQDAYASGKEIAVETSGTCLLAPDDAEDVINIIPRTGNPSDNNYR